MNSVGLYSPTFFILKLFFVIFIIMTKEYFLNRVKEIYGDNRFMFPDLSDNFNNKAKIKVICNKHGEFITIVCNFLNGRGCPLCNKEKNIVSFEDFIEKTNEVYGDKYSYNKCEYNRFTSGKITIHCNEHNVDFKQIPIQFLKHIGCPECAKETYNKNYSEFLERNKEKNKLDFIKKAREIHGDKYDYSKVEYINNRTKVCIICPEHGEFWQRPGNHLKGQGCRKCKYDYVTNIEDLNRLLIEKFGIEYDFSKSIFKNMTTKITVGYNGVYFNIKPNKLLHPDNGKPITHERVENYSKFIEKSKIVNNNLYDYSLINDESYKNTTTKVPIICKKHGVFYVTPEQHMQGVGCPHCNRSKLEDIIREFLIKNSIKFYEHYSADFLKTNKFCNKSYDFYLPEYNSFIECQGEQHFHAINYFGGEKQFEYQLQHDIEKYIKALDNNINLFYFKGNHTSLKTLMKNKVFQSIYNKENTFTNIDKLYKKLTGFRVIEATPVTDAEFKAL